MKYYVLSDVHAFYNEMIEALKERGFFEEKGEHKLIICGDLLDRGTQQKELTDFILKLMKEDRIILIRGNHEDLLENLVEDLLNEKTYSIEAGYSHHINNGTWQTALDISGYTHENALVRPKVVANLIKNSPFYKKIMSSMVDYYETDKYVFTHGYVPCTCTVGTPSYKGGKKFAFKEDWRQGDTEEWQDARWFNGMDFICGFGLSVPEKTVVCGHLTASYGHSRFENKGSEFGDDADFSPFYYDGLIAIDACVKYSGRINCIVLED